MTADDAKKLLSQMRGTWKDESGGDLRDQEICNVLGTEQVRRAEAHVKKYLGKLPTKDLFEIGKVVSEEIRTKRQEEQKAEARRVEGLKAVEN